MRVLIVEDEAEPLQLLTVYFEARGHVVFGARKGVEALEKFRVDSPELVLLDVRLPRLDGWRVVCMPINSGRVFNKSYRRRVARSSCHCLRMTII